MLRDEETLIYRRKDREAARWLMDAHLTISAVINQESVRALNSRVEELNHG